MNEYTVTIAFDDEAQKCGTPKLAAPEMLEINNMPHTGVHLVFKMEAQAVGVMAEYEKKSVKFCGNMGVILYGTERVIMTV